MIIDYWCDYENTFHTKSDWQSTTLTMLILFWIFPAKMLPKHFTRGSSSFILQGFKHHTSHGTNPLGHRFFNWKGGLRNIWHKLQLKEGNKKVSRSFDFEGEFDFPMFFFFPIDVHMLLIRRLVYEECGRR